MASAGWDGPDDPDNPLQWPMWKKVYHSAIPIAIGFLCPFGSSVYSPGQSQVEVELRTSSELAILPFSLYLLGLSFGPIFAGPASENFGRKAVYLTCLPLLAIFTLGAGFSKNIATLVVLRFFAGLFASPGLSIGTGTIADVWSPETRSVPIATYITMVQSGAAFGPLIGGFVTQDNGWRWTQWVILFALAGVIPGALFISETYKAVILKRRARADGKVEGGESAGRPLGAKLHQIAAGSLLRPLSMLSTELIVSLFDLYVAVNFGILNLFYTALPGVFRRAYSFDLGTIGLTFVSQVIGNLFGWVILVLYSKLYYQPLQVELSKQPTPRKPSPEKRLYLAMIGAPMIPVALFWLGWTARPSTLWASPLAAEALFSCGNLLIFSCASLYFVDCYGARYGASAWSSNTFLRYLFAAVFPLFSDQMYTTLGTGWASSLLGFITTLLVAIPFMFYRYGESIRARSKYVAEQ